MATVKDFVAQQTAFNDRQGKAIDAAVASVQGITSDIDALNAKIKELQDSAGQVTPEDQALIDQLQSQGGALADKLDALSTNLGNLDAQNPPTPPPTPA